MGKSIKSKRKIHKLRGLLENIHYLCSRNTYHYADCI